MATDAPVISAENESINPFADLDAPDVAGDTTPYSEVIPEVKPEVPTVSSDSAGATQPIPPVGTSGEPTVPEVKTSVPASEPNDRHEILQTLRQLRHDLALANARTQRQDEELKAIREVTKQVAGQTVQVAQSTVRSSESDDLVNFGQPTLQGVKLEEVKLPETKLSEFEELQSELADLGASIGSQLQTLVESMSFNPAYSDVKAVCSRSNLNDLVDAMASSIAADENLDPVVTALKVEKAIWSLDNPYKWMYNTIKANHPAYRKAPVVPKEPKSLEAPKPTSAPPSVVPIGSSAVGTSGFSASQLDLMDELDFIKVPENIRNMYLNGQLA